MITTILFGLSFMMLVAAIVVYTLKDDTTTKRWAEYTKALTTQNEALRKEWQDAIAMVKGVCANHGTLAGELERQKNQLEKLEFAVKTQPKSSLPMKIEFEPIKVLSVTKRATATKTTKKTATKRVANGARKPTAAEKKIMRKVKQQVRELSQ